MLNIFIHSMLSFTTKLESKNKYKFSLYLHSTEWAAPPLVYVALIHGTHTHKKIRKITEGYCQT